MFDPSPAELQKQLTKMRLGHSLNFDSIVGDREIQSHFRERIAKMIVDDEKRVNAELKLIEDVINGSSKLNYKEKLYLNRKGYMPVFKSVTREKRNNIPLGTAPLPKQMEPKISFIGKQSELMPVHQPLPEPMKRKETDPNQMLCPKLIQAELNP